MPFPGQARWHKVQGLNDRGYCTLRCWHEVSLWKWLEEPGLGCVPGAGPLLPAVPSQLLPSLGSSGRAVFFARRQQAASAQQEVPRHRELRGDRLVPGVAAEGPRVRQPPLPARDRGCGGEHLAWPSTRGARPVPGFELLCRVQVLAWLCGAGGCQVWPHPSVQCRQCTVR